MATKKKVLLEQETPVPENTAPADGTISSAGPPADAAAPPDSDDLSALLASMDQTNDSASTDQPDGDATLEGSDPPLEFMETEASDEAAPEDDGTASGAPSDSDESAGSADGEDGDGEEETPSNLSAEGADGTPAEMVSETAGEPAPPKTKRAPRRKKAAPVEDPVHGENEDSAEAPAAEEQAVEFSASVENTAPPDEGETPISEDTAPQEEAPVDTASALRRTAVTHRSDASILTIRSREEVETQEDREDVIWHEIHNASRTRRILTGQLGGIEQLDNRKTVAVVDYKGFRIIIPIKEMMINLGRSPSGQEYADLMLRQNKILGNMLGADIDFVVRGIDSKTRSVVASRREAMMRKRQIWMPRGSTASTKGVLFRPGSSLLRRKSSASRCSALKPQFWPVIWLGTGSAMPTSVSPWAMKCWSAFSMCGATALKTSESVPTSRAHLKIPTGTISRSAESRVNTPEK